MKQLLIAAILIFFSFRVDAQDAVLISEDNFVKGVIQGTDLLTVSILTEDQNVVQYKAKDIQLFVWNGDTYASKPIVIKKKMEYRFFKLIEGGTVNLYAYGDRGIIEQPAQQRTKIRPSIGIGVGGGGGLGGGVSIGFGGRRNEDQADPVAKGKVFYFLEKPGTGPMQEVNLENTNAVKKLLLQKLTNDEDLAQSINATESFDAKNLAAYVKAYNTGK